MQGQQDPDCICSVVYIGMKASGTYNLNPDCPVHGTGPETPWDWVLDHFPWILGGMMAVGMVLIAVKNGVR